MKKTVLLLLAMSSAHAADWSSIFGGGQAQPAQQQQTQLEANNAQPGFMESISSAMKVAQDAEIKALIEAKNAEYKDLGFFARMSKVMNDPQLQALVEAKMSGQRAIVNQQPVSQQPVAKPQAGFDWGSLFGGSQQQQQPQSRPVQQQAGFDWASLFGGGVQQQQAPQQQTQQGGFGQMLMKLLENAQQPQPAR